MGFTLVMPFLPLYFRELGVLEVGEIALWSGLSVGATPALTAVMAPAWGALADRFGRKIMVERALFSFVIVMGAMAFVTRPWHILALRMIQGLFAGYGALTLAMAVDSAEEGRVARSIGLVQTAQRLGPALGPIIGGTVAQLVGLRRAFLVAAALYGVALVLVIKLYEEQPSAPATTQGAARSSVTMREVLRFENLLLLFSLVFTLQFVDRSFGPILPLFISEIGVPFARVPLVSGVLFSVTAGAGALGHHLAGRLLERLSPRQVIARAAMLGSAGALLFAVSGTLGLLLVAASLFGLAIGIATTAVYTAASAVIPPGAHGAGFGVLSSASLVGLAVSPMLNGLLASFAIRAVFVLNAVSLFGLAIVVWRLMKESSGQVQSVEFKV